MKKKNTYEDHVKNLKEKKEALPFHKMDDVSRRNFIQGVGFFLAGIGVPSLFRFEKMSMLSKKIFGNSYAFAANPLTDRAVIKLYVRRGFSSSWMGVGYYNHDKPITTDRRNVPWKTGVTSTPIGNGEVILTPNVTGLSSYLGGIQNAMFKATGNHTETFNSCNRIGVMEMMTGRAATEVDTKSPLLGAGLFFGDTSIVAVMNNPPSLASNIPIPLTHVIDASNMFTPPNFTTNQGKVLGTTLQEKILATINNKFTGDIAAGVLQKDQSSILSSADQAQVILQNTFTKQLNPNDPSNSAKVTALRGGVPTDIGSASLINAMSMPDILFVLMQCFELKITPFIGGLAVNTQDHHPEVDLPAGTGSADNRYKTGAFLGIAVKNLMDAAKSGLWTNPYTGGSALEVMVVMTSEFSRSPLINGIDQNNPNNNDGFATHILSICSNTNQNLFVPGCWGGVSLDTVGTLLGYDVSNGSASHSAGIALPDINTMYGYQTDLLGIDRDKLKVSSTRYPGYPSLLK